MDRLEKKRKDQNEETCHTFSDGEILMHISKKADDVDRYAVIMKSLISRSKSQIDQCLDIIQESRATLEHQRFQLHKLFKEHYVSTEQRKAISEREVEIAELEKELALLNGACCDYSANISEANSEIDNVCLSVKNQIAMAFDIAFSS